MTPRQGNRPLGRVAVISLEAWDNVHRRNQHFATRLVGLGLADSLTFVEPVPGAFRATAQRRPVAPRIEALTPPQFAPRRFGGSAATAAWLRHALRRHDTLWLNDPVLGRGVRSARQSAVYDVTDDWRSMSQTGAERRRIVQAEDSLADSVRTVVCSDELRSRWQARYGVTAGVVRNGVDLDAIRSASPMPVSKDGPHAVYVGTLHPNRVDIELCVQLAQSWPGTIHLIGPEHFDTDTRSRLDALGVRRLGPVAASDVPRWLATADLLICPHVVDDFTLSLDAIKSHEYLATDKPVVATASSGFQSLTAPGLSVCSAADFVEASTKALGTGPWSRDVAIDWNDRTVAFADELGRAGTRR